MATTTSTSSLPDWATPYAQSLASRGNALSNQAYTPYSGQRNAALDPLQQQGFGLLTDRATQGSPEETAARSNYTDVMSGKNLDPNSNPYLKGMVNTAMNDVQGRVNSQFGGNNYGTTAHQETLQRGLGDTANQMYGQAYNQGLNQQTQYASMLPTYGNIDYNNAQKLVGVGDVYQQQNQQGLDNKYNDWLAQQNQPYKNLDVLSNSLNGAARGQSTTTQNSQSSTSNLANVLGYGSLGIGAYNALGGYSGISSGISGLLG